MIKRFKFKKVIENPKANNEGNKNFIRLQTNSMVNHDYLNTLVKTD